MSVAEAAPVRICGHACDLVQLAARRGQADAVHGAIRHGFALTLPPPGHASQAGAMSALWMQPDSWMLMAPPGADGDFARAVKAACGDSGSVVDQTHGRIVITVSGQRARDVLARICRVDLHPRVFGPGRVAAAPIAELPCLLSQRGDTPGFDVIVPASYDGWFRDALTHAAASVGYEVPDAGSSPQFRAGPL